MGEDHSARKRGFRIQQPCRPPIATRRGRMGRTRRRTIAGPLAHIRVIDATTRWGELTGRILAELGAEVIKVEPPGGCESRALPPFAGDESLYWAALGVGKRSVVAADPTAFLADADVFVESGRTEGIAERFPHIVHVSVTPFGTTGPAVDLPATELTVEAAGGLVGLQGNPDRPPLPMGAMPQAAFHAGAHAAADIAVALYERDASGLGQHLDVSAQAAVVWTLMHATAFPPNTGTNPPGTSEYRGTRPPSVGPGLNLPYVIPCADGYVVLRFQMPILGERTLHQLVRWAEDDGEDVPESVRGRDFNRWLTELREGSLEPEVVAAASDLCRAFVRRKTKLQMQTFSAQHGLCLAAIYDVADLLDDPQLAARDFWTEIAGRTHPGPFARLSGTPLVSERAAPALGELAPPQPRALPHRCGTAPPSPFAGIKVADFSWVGVGPMIGKALADHGATVVRIESPGRLDLLRTTGPFKDNIPGPNRTQFYANFNTSKLGMTLDLKTEGGRELAGRMAGWADVVLENFSPGTMARFGLDYETLSARHSDLVMLSTCMRGQTGPERTYSGFGNQGAAVAGMFGLVGWPDRPPVGPWGAYTDFIAPRFGVAALASALLHRKRTGEGQYIDLSQIETGIRFLEPLILDYTVNGRVAGAVGQRSPLACPHGVYPAAGHERYVAVAVESRAHWDALSDVVDLPCAFADRFDHADALDDLLALWMQEREPFAAAERMQRDGVPAYAVMRPSDLYHDPQLAHRGFFVTLDHPEMGPTPYDGPATIYSRTPQTLRRPAPMFGEHNEYVLQDILGLPDSEVRRYREAGALGAF